MKTPSVKMNILDVKSRRCVFGGYDGDELSYRVLDPVKKKTRCYIP